MPWRQKPITFSHSTLAPDVEIVIYTESIVVSYPDFLRTPRSDEAGYGTKPKEKREDHGHSARSLFHLHSSLLRVSSDFFDRSMSPAWWDEKNSVQDASSIKYRYILYSEGDDDTPILLPAKEAGTTKKTKARVSDQTKEDHTNLFGLFYGAVPKIPLIQDVEALVRLADLYGCIHAISRPLESEIVRSQPLLELLPLFPHRFSKIALKLKAKDLYSECFVLMVGNWYLIRDEVEQDSDHPLAEATLQLVERTYMDLLAEKNEVDRRIMKLMVSAESLRMQPSPFVDILEAHAEEKGLGRRMYIAIRDYNITPIYDLDEIESWNELSSNINAFTKDLSKCNLKFTKHFNHGFLTCATVGKYPWEEEANETAGEGE